MRAVFLTLTLTLAVAFVGACTRAPDAAPAPVQAPAVTSSQPPARAVAAAGALKGELKAALEAAMQSGGPESAVEVCKDKAQAIAFAHSKDGLAVGRTSHKLRNPANAPRPWVQPLLDELVKPDPTKAASLEPRTVALEGGRIGYVEPIVMGPVCVACHGDTIAPSVQAKLAAAYPLDQATGFKPGDLRGLVWVEMPAP